MKKQFGNKAMIFIFAMLLLPNIEQSHVQHLILHQKIDVIRLDSRPPVFLFCQDKITNEKKE